MADDADSKWHLDKRVPIALILVAVAQTFAAVYWVARTDGAIADHERRIVAAEMAARDAAKAGTETNSRLARIEAQLENLNRALWRQAPQEPR